MPSPRRGSGLRVGRCGDRPRRRPGATGASARWRPARRCRPSRARTPVARRPRARPIPRRRGERRARRGEWWILRPEAEFCTPRRRWGAACPGPWRGVCHRTSHNRDKVPATGAPVSRSACVSSGMVSKASVGALLAVGAALAAAVGPAAAVDDTKPTAACGYTFEDADGDQANTQVPAADMTPATELLNGFIKYDAAKGDQAATYI